MNFATHYFQRYTSYPYQVEATVPTDTETIIVIPSLDEPNLLRTLQSLYACAPTRKTCEVIVVINAPEHAPQQVLQQNEQSYTVCQQWINNTPPLPHIHFHFIKAYNLPRKFAGAGLARKIGMDAALKRFGAINNQHGVIVSLDADTTVANNYLVTIQHFFAQNPHTAACNLYFEHPLQGNDFEPRTYNLIAQYELHLRYMVEALRFSGFPKSYHALGSAIAIRAEVYAKLGGMNRRQAGEDFYFLQKIIAHSPFAELNDTCVYPSPRQSYRVPFGTGRTMTDALTQNVEQLTTYHLQSYIDIKHFLQHYPSLFRCNKGQIDTFLQQLSASLREFLVHNQFGEAIHEINQHCASMQSFAGRFFDWFNGFRVFKLLNHQRDNHYGTLDTTTASTALLQQLSLPLPHSTNTTILLHTYRQHQKNNPLATH